MVHPRLDTLTFLLTDIVGSARRWEEQFSAMSAALTRHDALMRAVIAYHDGYVFKTVGDGFCIAFDAPHAALTAAIAAQRVLLAEDWPACGPGFAPLRVRMALHTGTAEMRLGDFVGPPVNRAARLLETGHGGQLLVTQATAVLVADRLPPGVSLRPLGQRRLRDLPMPEFVVQALAPGLPHSFPPLRTMVTRRDRRSAAAAAERMGPVQRLGQAPS
jgi:class 3 adenylate cyclase